MWIACKRFAYKVHVEQPDYYIITLFYKSFLGIRVSEYFNSYSQAKQAPIKVLHKI